MSDTRCLSCGHVLKPEDFTTDLIMGTLIETTGMCEVCHVSAHRCPIDGYPVDVATDGAGNVVVKCEACRRRRSRRCMDCGQPVVGRSWRCETHKLMAQKEATQRSERRNREERNAAGRKRYWKKPGHRERRCADKKAWREQNRLKVAMSKRKGRLDGTWGYRSREAFLEAMRKQNEKRKDRHRQWAKDHQSVYYQNGKKLHPRCAKCGGVITWDRRGRPKKYHPKCNPRTQRKTA